VNALRKKTELAPWANPSFGETKEQGKRTRRHQGSVRGSFMRNAAQFHFPVCPNAQGVLPRPTAADLPAADTGRGAARGFQRRETIVCAAPECGGANEEKGRINTRAAFSLWRQFYSSAKADRPLPI